MKIDERIPRDVYWKILQKVKSAMSAYGPYVYNTILYYPIFSKQGKHLSVEIIAVKLFQENRKNKKAHLWMKKVVVHIVGKNICYVRDIYKKVSDFYNFAVYKYLFDRSVLKHAKRYVIKKHYTDMAWQEKPCKEYRLYNNRWFLNCDFLYTLPEYRYCAYDDKADAFSYLTAYKENPKIELLAKLLNCRYAKASCINKKAERDKNFLLFLRDNASYIKAKRPTSNDICAAYNKKVSIETQSEESTMRRNFYTTFWRRHYLRDDDLAYIQYQNLDRDGRTKMIRYLIRNKINPETYKDYLIALRELGLDMSDTKNLYPLDWQYWHDMRMHQYATSKAKINRAKKAAITRRIKAKAKEYAALLMQNENFHILLASSKKELVKEGEYLHHCVGRMDYDQRIIEGRSLVCFVRKASAPDVPFVTIEYSLQKNQVVQCYGKGDTTPNEDVMQFVENVWQPRAKAIIQKMQKVAEAA